MFLIWVSEADIGTKTLCNCNLIKFDHLKIIAKMIEWQVNLLTVEKLQVRFPSPLKFVKL